LLDSKAAKLSSFAALHLVSIEAVFALSRFQLYEIKSCLTGD
jgi:hypothetical protein